MVTMLLKYSVFVVIFCITLISGDVSHLQGHSSVDHHTIEILKQNISNYLQHLGNDGSPQMQLKEIYGASKQVVTGTVYTVHAKLETTEGVKDCEIRVLEQPLFDFCTVRVSCENGGQYEVTLNPYNNAPANTHGDYYNNQAGHQNQYDQTYQYQQPQQHYNQYQNQHQQSNQYQNQHQQSNQYQNQHQQSNQYQNQHQQSNQYQNQHQQSNQYQHSNQHQHQQSGQYQQPHQNKYQTSGKPSFNQFTSRIETQAPVYDYQSYSLGHSVAPEHPVATFNDKPPRPVYPEQPRQQQHGIPKPIIPPAPELHELPYDQIPQGPALDSYLRQLFEEFMIKYNRDYIDVPGEREYRFGVFTENFHTMHEYSLADNLSSQYAITEFADLTNDEFSHILGFDTKAAQGLNGTEADTSMKGITGQMPEKYDERDENYVTRVKLQGDCGACWAFTTVAVIEGLCARRVKKLQEFSEQSLLDCDKSNYGCKGGFSPNAIKHLVKRGGLELETVYPYVFAQTQCHFEPKTVRVKVAGVVNFKKNDEEGMKRWLFKNGPILVGINSAPLKYYKAGVMNPTPAICNPKKIDHGVTLIGYGVEVNTSSGEKLPYWIVKNSWGPRWGENGFFRIVRGKNACGLALWAYSAKLADVPNNCLLPDGK